MIVSLFKLLRVHQWIKNTFIFIPAFFAKVIFEQGRFVELVIGFFAFSLIASSIYILNDIHDVEKDRQHPVKKNRPIANGSIPVSLAYIVSGISAFVGLGVAYFLGLSFLAVVVIYFIQNILYSLKLKHIAVIDITLIATGFLLRVIAGGVLAEVHMSNWLMIMTFLLAMFLGFAKRRDDLIISEESGKVLRSSQKGYNYEFISNTMMLLSGVIMVAYIMYTLSPEVISNVGSEYVYVTSVFVLLGIIRYLQLTFVKNKSGSPVKILYNDPFIIAVMLGWGGTFILLLYVFQR